MKFDYISSLYRRDNNGAPMFWNCTPAKEGNAVTTNYGYVGGKVTTITVDTHRAPLEECTSRIEAKRKTGYKYLDELKDNVSLPVEEGLLDYLNAYLPYNRTTSDGKELAMLAKVYDNTNNKLFAKCPMFLGQYKINGLRCSIRAIKTNDLFSPIRLEFQSREGVIWKSLFVLESNLLNILPTEFLDMMLEYNIILDGEVYLPGHTVNEIDHFIKTANCKENSYLQFWCYDLINEELIQQERLDLLYKHLNPYVCHFINKTSHLNVNVPLIVLPTYEVTSDNVATTLRDRFIDNGFEGLIMRNPNKEYQYGKRNLAMIKYKRHTDGKFLILAIYPEGVKRPDIPLIACKNDINDESFEVHIGGTLDYQREVLKHKKEYIGKYLHIEYGERSGVKQTPFHVKRVELC